LFDAPRNILVTELLPEGENLSEYHRRLGQFPLQVAARLGDLIGAYHRQIKPSSTDAAQGSVFTRTVPWILSAHQLANSPVQTMGGASQQIMGIINRYADFHQYLDTLRTQWRTDCFMHGDMKWENCIVYPQNGGVEVKIVDWETADFGDACWDVGAIFQAYLTFWIMSIPIQGEMSPDQFLQLAPYPIEAMQPAIRAFWLAYLQARPLSEAERRDVLVRSAGYGAARMLQTAFEYMYYSPQITMNALALLQVSLNILSDPRVAARELLNL
jgi:thiamine kinase-like enzyme